MKKSHLNHVHGSAILLMTSFPHSLSLSITASSICSGVDWSAQRGNMSLCLKVWRKTTCLSWNLQTYHLLWEERQSHSSVTGKASLPSTRSYFSLPWRAHSHRHYSRQTVSVNMWVTSYNGWHSGSVGTTVTSQQDWARSPFCACSSSFCVGFILVSHYP